MPQIQSLQELKVLLQIDPNDTYEDISLSFILDYTTSWIEELLGRRIFLATNTEYYNGTGSQKLLLRRRPVFTTPTIEVSIDQGGYYGSASGAFTGQGDAQVYGEDFCLDIDQDDGTSRSGILVLLKQFWPKPPRREVGYLSPFIGPVFGNIKVSYKAGYSVATLPGTLRMAAMLIVAKLRYILPLGLEVSSESYEERSISVASAQKGLLLATVMPMLNPYRNWHW